MSGFQRCGLALGAIAALGVGCASSGQVMVADGVDIAPVSALVVLPFEAQFPCDPWEPYIQTLSALDLALSWGQVPVLGPGDWDAYGPGEGLVGRSLDGTISQLALDPASVLVLKTSAYLSGGARFGGPTGAAEQEMTLTLKVSAFPLDGGIPWITVEEDLVVSPFDRGADGDPYPVLTVRHRALVEQVLEAADDLMEGPAPPPLPMMLASPHEALFQLSAEGQSSLGIRLEAMEPLDRAARLWTVYERIYPGLEGVHLGSLPVQPGGLLVVDSEQSGLEVGDVLLRANGLRLHGVQQLQRMWMMAAPGETLALSILRGDEAVDGQLRRPTGSR